MNARATLVCATVAAGLALPATAQEHSFNFGHAAASSHLFHTGLEMFAELVAEKTDGRVEINVFGDRLLGDDRQLMEGLQLGTIDGAVVSAPVIPLAVAAPAFDALQLPFVVPSYAKMGEVLSSDLGRDILDTLGEHDIKGLGFVEAGLRHFLTRGDAVLTVADFSGLRTRIVPTPLHRATWEAVGTSPVGLAYGEVYSALETGAIDAVEINLSSIQSESLYQAAQNVTLTGHFFWPGVLMVSGPVFDGLPEDIQQAMIEAGHEVIAAHYALAAADEAEVTERLTAAGVTISELAELEAMQDRMAPVVEQWRETDPLVGRFIAAMGE